MPAPTAVSRAQNATSRSGPASDHGRLPAAPAGGDRAGAQARSGRLGARARQLEKKLSGLLGEQAWQESGLGAPQDTGTLKRRITDLEQKTADLSGQLAERTGELAAARAANREMMAHLNSTSH